MKSEKNRILAIISFICGLLILCSIFIIAYFSPNIIIIIILFLLGIFFSISLPMLLGKKDEQYLKYDLENIERNLLQETIYIFLNNRLCFVKDLDFEVIGSEEGIDYLRVGYKKDINIIILNMKNNNLEIEINKIKKINKSLDDYNDVNQLICFIENIIKKELNI